MFGHRSFLILGGASPADIKSLIEGGYEMANCRFGFRQGVDAKGKSTTSVQSGVIDLVLFRVWEA